MTSGPSPLLWESVRLWPRPWLGFGNLNLPQRRGQRLLASHVYEIAHGHLKDFCKSVQGVQPRIPFTTFQLSQKPGCNGVGGHIELRQAAKPASFPHIVANEFSKSREIHAIQATRNRPLVSVHYRDDFSCRSHGVEVIFDVWRAMRMQRIAAVTVITTRGRRGMASVAAGGQTRASDIGGSDALSKFAAIVAPEVNTQQGTGETQC